MKFHSFIIFWISQFGSILGRSISSYAIMLWIFEKHQSASSVTLGVGIIGTFQILIGPFAGKYVDRVCKKKLLIFTDIIQIFSFSCLIILFTLFKLPYLYLIYFFLFISALIDTLQYPTLMSIIPKLVAKENLLRANGLISLYDSLSTLFAPLVAAVLLTIINIHDILLINSFLFLISILVLSFFKIKEYSFESTNEEYIKLDIDGFFDLIDSISGARFFFFINILLNFCISGSFVLFAPFVLKISSGDSILLGSLMSLGGGSQIIIGLFTSMMPFPKNIYRANMIAVIVMGVFGVLLIGLSRDPIFLAIGLCVFMGTIPFINATNRSIWQSKIPNDFQGRFFAIRRSISKSAVPIAQIFAGFFVDFVLDPRFSSPTGLSYNISISIFAILLIITGVYGLNHSLSRCCCINHHRVHRAHKRGYERF